MVVELAEEMANAALDVMHCSRRAIADKLTSQDGINAPSNSNSAAHGAAGTANGDDPLRDLTEGLFFSEAATAGAARDLTLAAGRGVVASARARLPRGTGMPFFPPFRK